MIILLRCWHCRLLPRRRGNNLAFLLVIFPHAGSRHGQFCLFCVRKWQQSLEDCYCFLGAYFWSFIFFINMCYLAFKNNEISYNACFDNGICLWPIWIAGQNHLIPNRVWFFQLRNQWYLVVFWLLHCKLLLLVYFVCSVLYA